MKQTIRFCLIALLIASFSGTSIAKTFKIATFAPAGTEWLKQMKQGAAMISEKTTGRVKLKYYPGGVMGNNASVHRKIKIGQLQGGAFTGGDLAGFYPDIQVLSLPMLFNSFDEVDYVRSKLDPVLKQNMEKNGFVLLGIAEGGFAQIMSREPMVKLESIRASRVWIPEGDIVVQETYKTLGISPISLPISDVYTGLQTGLIDTISVNSTAAIAFQWHTSTPYLTDTPIIYLIGLFAIQKKAFDKISPADQVIVREVIADVFKALDSLNRADNIQASEALKALGTIYVKPEPEELQRWQTLSAQAIDNMVAEGIVTRGMVDVVRGHLSTYRSSQ